MFGIERQQEILDVLKERHSVTVNWLAKHLYIGEATIRRDLDILEKKGFVKRIYGGAILVGGSSSEIPLLLRETERRESKSIICAQAAELVNDGDIIIMDSSSTTFMLIDFLNNKKDLTIITNGAKTAIALAETQARVYSTGGWLRKNSLSYVGHQARNFIDGIYADILFFSCRGLSEDGFLYDAFPDEVECRQMMLAHAKMSVLLCDSSKIGKKSFHKICKASEVDKIICDQPLPEGVE